MPTFIEGLNGSLEIMSHVDNSGDFREVITCLRPRSASERSCSAIISTAVASGETDITLSGSPRSIITSFHRQAYLGVDLRTEFSELAAEAHGYKHYVMERYGYIAALYSRFIAQSHLDCINANPEIKERLMSLLVSQNVSPVSGIQGREEGGSNVGLNISINDLFSRVPAGQELWRETTPEGTEAMKIESSSRVIRPVEESSEGDLTRFEITTVLLSILDEPQFEFQLTTIGNRDKIDSHKLTIDDVSPGGTSCSLYVNKFYGAESLSSSISEAGRQLKDHSARDVCGTAKGLSTELWRVHFDQAQKCDMSAQSFGYLERYPPPSTTARTNTLLDTNEQTDNNLEATDRVSIHSPD